MTELKNIMLCATAFAPSLVGAKDLPNIIYIELCGEYGFAYT